MGARVAVVKQGISHGLSGFSDTIVAKLKLSADHVGIGDNWVLMARVLVRNGDSDPQFVTVKLVHDANVVILEDRHFLNHNDYVCIYLQTGFKTTGAPETITLECNTFQGGAENASLMALQVDELFLQ
jgi:hypothetical protein